MSVKKAAKKSVKKAVRQSAKATPTAGNRKAAKGEKVAILALDQRLRSILVCWLIATTNEHFLTEGNADGVLRTLDWTKLPGLKQKDRDQIYNAASTVSGFKPVREAFWRVLEDCGFNAAATQANTPYPDHDCPKSIDEILELLT